MMLAGAIVIGLYFGMITIVVIVGGSLQRRKQLHYRKGNRIDVNDITVLIPFRNESSRIKGLLQSIKNLNLEPKNFVFIDDHSTDNSQELIKECENDKIRILNLPEGIYGKKDALNVAIQEVETKYILTWDADIVVPVTYFESLSQLEEADMYVLPAVMVGNSLVEHLFEIDLLSVNASNCGLAGLIRPIMASGANLLYQKSSYLSFNQLDKHRHISSGDDTFLLREFQLGGGDVRLLADYNTRIETETPQSFKEFLDQRLRWIGKTKDLKDNLSSTLAITQAILSIAYFGILLLYLFQERYELALVYFGLKCAIDFIAFAQFYFHFKRFFAWFLIPVYQVLYPFYVLIIALSLLFYKPKWKGRSIYN